MKFLDCGWKHNYEHVICANECNIYYPLCGWILKFGAPLSLAYTGVSLTPCQGGNVRAVR